MPLKRLRRALLALACVSSALLASCGGGDIVSQFNPGRLVVFGDAFSDLGQNGTRYTVNGSGGVDNWTQQLASRYGLSVAARNAGGTSYATGSARVAAKPDAAGNAATPTVAEQVDAFLGAGSFSATDLVVVSGGVGDLIAEGAAAMAGTQTADQAQAAVEQAGRNLGAQVRRVVDAGATHVVVVGPYNLGRSPWARAAGQQGLMENLTTRFNEALLVSIVDLGSKVLYVDAALYFNLVTGNAVSYGFDNVTGVACASVDPGAGIGIGAGQVSSALCNTGTLAGGISLGTTLFADPVYVTPAAHVRFGDYAFDRLRQRF
jgi:phospholipase/lecithinase/hemolysin